MPDSGPEGLLRLLSLKAVLRKGWTRYPLAEVESVADHSYGVALLAWLLCPEGLNRDRVVQLALLHDLAEVVTGDLTPSDNVPPALKASQEMEALSSLLGGFGQRDCGLELLADYQSQASPEGRFVKAIDKLEMFLQSLAYERASGLDLREFRESAEAIVRDAGLLEWVQFDASPKTAGETKASPQTA